MNLFNYQVPAVGETFTPLLNHKNITIQRIISSETPEGKTYIQEEDEWVVILEGEAILHIDAKERRLRKGDTLFIPARTPHKVLEAENGTLWLTVHIG